MKKLAWFVLGFAVMSLCGCETVKGVGRDIVGASAFVQNGIGKS